MRLDDAPLFRPFGLLYKAGPPTVIDEIARMQFGTTLTYGSRSRQYKVIAATT